MKDLLERSLVFSFINIFSRRTSSQQLPKISQALIRGLIKELTIEVRPIISDGGGWSSCRGGPDRGRKQPNNVTPNVYCSWCAWSSWSQSCSWEGRHRGGRGVTPRTSQRATRYLSLRANATSASPRLQSVSI